MVMKCTAVCLVALALLGSFCDAQYGGSYKPSKPTYQQTEAIKQIPQEPQQVKQKFEKPITWTYPAPPPPDPVVDVPFELRHPVPAATVAVECRETIAHVEVKKDMFGIGQFVNPADLTLGNCAPVAEDNAAGVLIFQAELHDCLSTTVTTDDALIYTFVLNYNPRPLGDSLVVRTNGAAVIVECHYPRKHNVSSLPIDPLWIPFSAVKVAEEFLYFTLKLMTDDWQYERPSYQYFLGDVINVEAVVKQYFHVPLRVYVDHCVATLSADTSSTPRYAFIDNHGCMLDGRITGSESKFMGRSADNKLQFQLEAFRFQGAESGLLYITCHLKATSVSYGLDGAHRACSYISGWREASGADAACGSCETSGLGPVPNLAYPGAVSSGSSIGIGGSSGIGTGPATGLGAGGISGGGLGGGLGGGNTAGKGGSSSQSLIKHSRKMREVIQEYVEWEGEVTLGPIPIMEKE